MGSTKPPSLFQSPFNTLSQWHCICIEEPFTLSNAAHSVYDERIFQEIKKAFADSYRELDKNRDLDSFLGKPADEENGKEEEEPENGIAVDDEQPQQQPSSTASPLECSLSDDAIIDDKSPQSPINPDD